MRLITGIVTGTISAGGVLYGLYIDHIVWIMVFIGAAVLVSLPVPPSAFASATTFVIGSMFFALKAATVHDYGVGDLIVSVVFFLIMIYIIFFVNLGRNPYE